MADRRALRFLSLLLLAGAQYLALESMAIDGDGGPSDTSVGVDEHLGGVIPADIAFYDEHGARRTMGELVDRPTILALVFYHCPGICGMIQGNLGGALKDVKRAAGRDYRILSASFDDEETPDLAAEAASNYTGIAGMALPEDAWRFTTGDAADIKRICDAVGFRYVKNGTHDYTHPALVTVLSKDRKIIRYLYGTQYLPLDIEMALSEAERNQPGVSIRRMISYCYSYDPKSGRYVFGLFRVAGATTITVMGLLLFFLLRRRPERGQGGGTP